MRSLFFSIPVLSLYSLLASCRHPPFGYAVLEKRNAPQEWVKSEALHPRTIVPVRVALKENGLDMGPDYLMNISDPTSSHYGKHWTAEDVKHAFSPSDNTVETVSSWLSEAGVKSHRLQPTASKGYLKFYATLEELQKLVKTEYSLYRHTATGDHMFACDQYHVPKSLTQHIDFITPGVGSIVRPRKVLSDQSIHKREEPTEENCASVGLPLPPNLNNHSLESCWEGVFPECLNALYGIPKNSTPAVDNYIGVFANNATYVQSDMDIFFKNLAPQIPKGTKASNVLLNGVNVTREFSSQGGDYALEADLDFQVIWPHVYPANVTLFSAVPSEQQLAAIDAQFANDSDISALLNALVLTSLEDVFNAFDSSYCTDNSTGTPCGVARAPTVFTLSYGAYENSSTAMVNRICNEILKLGLQGTTVLTSAGDGGVALRGGTCSNNNTAFNPSPIASCPWITSVGATVLTPPPTGEPLSTSQETASYNLSIVYSTSGGFSNLFPAPEYQKPALAKYLYEQPPALPSYVYNGSVSSILPGAFNRLGRGFPDVAALGQNFSTVAGGCLSAPQGSGSSLSAPLFATVIWHLNNERMGAGKGPLGFINPALYANPQVLNDVVTGGNTGCDPTTLEGGFSAVSGWDPVTGLGTPIYERMKALFMSLP